MLCRAMSLFESHVVFCQDQNYENEHISHVVIKRGMIV